ncbi:hypothetical protein U9M48_031892 [Paspalum notatum var. saurae]|uniref:Uncharacterized protein n=1 Tax=Paspalum notatum var. saurae TaxID=547442 RepID=A0AAQ3X572_PASNO
MFAGSGCRLPARPDQALHADELLLPLLVTGLRVGEHLLQGTKPPATAAALPSRPEKLSEDPDEYDYFNCTSGHHSDTSLLRNL